LAAQHARDHPHTPQREVKTREDVHARSGAIEAIRLESDALGVAEVRATKAILLQAVDCMPLGS
jgi:hypothetical protein